jgi:hypothetical protein
MLVSKRFYDLLMPALVALLMPTWVDLLMPDLVQKIRCSVIGYAVARGVSVSGYV